MCVVELGLSLGMDKKLLPGNLWLKKKNTVVKFTFPLPS